MPFLEIQEHIYSTLDNFVKDGKLICPTSSFQTQSVPLLHILSNYKIQIPILFIDKGYHFAETYSFKNQLQDLFGLKIITAQSNVSKLNQIDSNGTFLYETKPDNCCDFNKTIPLNQELAAYDIWITGVRKDQTAHRKQFRKDQTAHRKQLSEFETIKTGLVKFHPMLDWNSKMVYDYMKKHNVPQPPLEDKGYLSVDCTPCTRNVQE